MNKKIKSLLLALAFSFSAFCVGAQSSSLDEVLVVPDSFDSKTVEIEGEVIGEVLLSDSGAWINIKDESYNIGIFAQKASEFTGIKHWGSHRQQGDRIKVKGVFSKDCPLHQISDLHLESFEVIKQGYARNIEASPQKKKAATNLFIICLTTAVIYLIKVKYGKRITTDRRRV